MGIVAPGGQYDSLPYDTIRFCPGSYLRSSFLFASFALVEEDEYEWHTGWDGTDAPQPTPAGMWSLEYNSLDGCRSRVDTVQLIHHPVPSIPPMSDSFGVNTEAVNTSTVEPCPGDSVWVWATFNDDVNVTYSPSNYQNTDSVLVLSSTNVHITLTNEFGCTRSNSLHVDYHPVPSAAIVPELRAVWNGNLLGEGDTAYVCPSKQVSWSVRDSLTNEDLDTDYFSFEWSADNTPWSPNGNPVQFFPSQSGFYTIQVELAYLNNVCFENNTTYTFSQTIYVERIPAPSVSLSVSAPPFGCPGNEVEGLISWAGELEVPNSVTQNGDSLIFPGSGSYYFEVSEWYWPGCTTTSFQNVTINPWPVPMIFTVPSPPLICPDDSVQLFPNAGQCVKTWFGPGGLIGEFESVYATEPGPYVLAWEHEDGCEVLSNTTDILGYTTPYLTTWPPSLCTEGGEVTITIAATHPESIEWQPPLSGGGLSRTVTEPGMYEVIVTACDIVSVLSVTVEYSDSEINIQAINSGPVCEGNPMALAATQGYTDYLWSTDDTSPVISVESPGEVTVSATDFMGCTLFSPPFLVEFAENPPLPEIDFTHPCVGDQVVLSSGTDTLVTHWTLGGAEFTTGQQFLIPEVLNPLNVTAYHSNALCTSGFSTVVVEPKARPDAPVPAQHEPVCTGQLLQLEVLNPDIDLTYAWIAPNGMQYTGAEWLFTVESEDAHEGDYAVGAILNGCPGDTAITAVSVITTREVSLGPDTTVCAASNLVLYTDTVFASYEWSDGTTLPTLEPQSSGTYEVYTLDFNDCPSIDDVDVVVIQCMLTAPNVFTPNGDGRNDLWQPWVESPRRYIAKVMNRYGREVFTSDDHMRGWDGTNLSNGEPCEGGVYFYLIEYVSFDGLELNDTGELLLVR